MLNITKNKCIEYVNYLSKHYNKLDFRIFCNTSIRYLHTNIDKITKIW